MRTKQGELVEKKYCVTLHRPNNTSSTTLLCTHVVCEGSLLRCTLSSGKLWATTLPYELVEVDKESR
jgi:hypothetical protein